MRSQVSLASHFERGPSNVRLPERTCVGVEPIRCWLCWLWSQEDRKSKNHPQLLEVSSWVYHTNILQSDRLILDLSTMKINDVKKKTSGSLTWLLNISIFHDFPWINQPSMAIFNRKARPQFPVPRKIRPGPWGRRRWPSWKHRWAGGSRLKGINI